MCNRVRRESELTDFRVEAVDSEARLDQLDARDELFSLDPVLVEVVRCSAVRK